MAHASTQWLASIYIHAAQAVGATADEAQLAAEADAVLTAWADPQRSCHNVKYLVRVLDALDQLAGCAHAPEELQLAAFYHGAVFYEPRRLDYIHAGRDFHAGARMAEERLGALGVPSDTIGRIRSLIEIGAGETDPSADIDAQVFHDALLTTLAMAPQDYKDYRAAMGDQYAHLPRRLFLLGRRRQVRSLLARPAVFLSPLAQDDEELARTNLASELARLNQEIGVNEDDSERPPESFGGPTSGTIIIKKVKAKLKAETGEETPPVTPTDLPPEPVLEEIAPEAETGEDQSTLESVVDAIAEIASAPVPERPSSPDEGDDGVDDEDA